MSFLPYLHHPCRLICMLACTMLLSGYQVAAQPFAYRFNHLTVDEGLSHTDANCITQDQKGYIWIGTLFGINRFDGYNVKKYYNSNEPLKNSYKNRVKALLADAGGNLWIGSEGGLQRFDSKTEKYIDYTVQGLKTQPTFSKLVCTEPGSLYTLTDGTFTLYSVRRNILINQHLAVPKGIAFEDMTCDKSGNVYLTSNNGVWLLDGNKRFQRLIIRGLPNNQFSRIYVNKHQQLLISFKNTVYLTRKAGVNTITVMHKYSSPEDMYILQLCEDNSGKYWINGKTGLINLDAEFKLIQITTNKTPGSDFHTQSLTDIFIDRSQSLWVSTFGGGVNYRDLNEKKFYTFKHDASNPNSISANYVRCVLEEPGKGLWIGTDGGLNYYDYRTGKNVVYNTNASIKLKNNDILSLMLDQEHNLWLGSWAGIEIINADRTGLLHLPGSDQLPAYAIETLAKDIYGNVWFGNHMNRFGVICKSKGNNLQVKYYDESYFILPDDKKGEIFASSTHGLKRLIIDEEGNILKSYNYRATGAPNSLSSDYTYPISKQNDSIYWVGTIGGGLNKFTLRRNNTFSFKSYTEKQGVFNDVETLEIDDTGNIWMGGNGLLCLNPKTNTIIKYGKNDGLQGNSFKVGASYKGKDGRLYFGGINGLNYFNPQEIKSSRLLVHPVLTDLLINNKKPTYAKLDSNGSSLPQIITYTTHLKLNYEQNNFVIYFSAMHFGNPAKCRYRYKLTGYDKDWIFTDGKNPSAFYSNLDYRDYKFVVEATNPDGIWSNDEAAVDVTVTPPWWKSTMAKVVYLGLFISGLLWIYIYQARWYQLKRELAVRAVNENKREEMHRQREELYQQQLQFFTNISHELRTPLTLILGPLEILINNNKDQSVAPSFQLMFRNIKRLVNLINELMNFKKAADSAIKLQVKPINIQDFSKSLFMEFEHLAASKNISFRFVDHTDSINKEPRLGFFDAQILEKILFNLLSNALKYTDNGGAVTFYMFFDKEKFIPSFNAEFRLPNPEHRAEKYIYFLISDTGIGISKDSISSIFDRYYQIGTNHLGSGVGLALVKMLTSLHKGDIAIYSERNKGTEFLVALPWGRENYTDGELLATADDQGTTRLERTDISPLVPIKNEVNSEKFLPERIAKHILLVDDNPELRTFLKQALEKFYFIDEAENGLEAIHMATQRTPDLIISDVMMPGMTGIELCQAIKEKFETSHIPFVILSAKDALDTKIEGMESGADYYFAKPLSVDLLLLTVHNIFQQSQKLKLKYTRDYLTSATELVHSERDKDFMEKMLTLIEDNIQDPNLDVDFLCNHLYISRSKLYQKIKSISDQSIGDFIKTIRLKKAIQLMTHEVLPFNEVAYRTGFQSQGYFSRVFKKEFNKSPSEYMQSLKN